MSVLNTLAVCKQLGIRNDRVAWLIRQGHFKPPEKLGRQFIWTPADVARLEATLRAQAAR